MPHCSGVKNQKQKICNGFFFTHSRLKQALHIKMARNSKTVIFKDSKPHEHFSAKSAFLQCLNFSMPHDICFAVLG
jgi:hypothetical protein